MSNLRFVQRDGKNILQQAITTPTTDGKGFGLWVDVPLVEEPPLKEVIECIWYKTDDNLYVPTEPGIVDILSKLVGKRTRLTIEELRDEE